MEAGSYDDAEIILQSLSNYEITVSINEEERQLVFNPYKQTLSLLGTDSESIVFVKATEELPKNFIGTWTGVAIYENTEIAYRLTITENGEITLIKEITGSPEDISEFYTLSYTNSKILLKGIAPIYGEALFTYRREETATTLTTDSDFLGCELILSKIS